MSDFRYEIKTSLPVNWLETIDTKNPGWSVRNELITTNWSWLIRLMMKKRSGSSDFRFPTDNARSKENGRILTLIRSTLLSIITFYIGYGNRINLFKYFWCDHRLTSVRQLDLQEAGKLALKIWSLWRPRKYFRKLKLNFEIDRVNFLSEKSKQIFSQKVNKYFMSTNWLWSQINAN